MSTVKVINVQHPSSASPNIVLDASGNATMAGSMSMATPFAMRNKIINGAMEIDQRNAGASITPSTGQYSLDRWVSSLSQASKYSIQQNAGAVTPPTGFKNYLGVVSLSSYSVVASDFFSIVQRVEGINMVDFAFGTATAKSITVSFWVRSSLTGTFGASIQNGNLDRSYPFTYTISATNTWEYKTVTIPGDTTGTWATDTSVGLNLRFNLGTGSDRTGPANAWASANYNAPNSTVSVVGTNGATFYLTGVQIEVGTIATPFERRLITQELSFCQRYLPAYRGTAARIVWPGSVIGSTQLLTWIPFPVTPRTPPTGLYYSNLSDFYGQLGGGTFTPTAIAFSSAGNETATLLITVSGGGLTAGQSQGFGYANGNAVLYFTGCEL